MNITRKKVLIAGIQGSGKTHLARELVKGFKVMVYTPHLNEWNRENVYLCKPDDFIKEFPLWCKIMKQKAIEHKINCVVFDELDMLFKHHFDTCLAFKDLVINHRHYGLSIVGITRRPQSLPTALYEQFEFVVSFKIEGPNVIKKFEEYYEGFGEMVKALDYGKHEFAVKEIGKKPYVAVV